KKLVARIEHLAFFVARISAMLANDDNAIDREPRAAERERLRNRRVNGNVETLGPFAAEVLRGKLIHIERDELRSRMMPLAFPAVAFEKTIDEMLRVRVPVHIRRDECNAFAAA